MKAVHPDGEGSAATGAVLEARSIAKRFGGAVVLDGVSLALASGDLTALIGPNGAGKSTLFGILAGEMRPTRGGVYLGGSAVADQPAHRRLAAGLGRTFQIPRPFAAMTVVENVMLGAQRQRGERIWANLLAGRSVARAERAAFARAMELVDFVALGDLARQPARVLSGGQRKLLELARVLMAEPRIVLLDEPAAGVNPTLLAVLIERIATLNRRGTTFLVIEHNMDMVAALCRKVIVLTAGKLLCEGTPREVIADPRVIEAYLGSAAA
jgi:branched-chain amino acid transport system ATP-binding protein